MIKLALLFGGCSNEHEVSISSASSIYENIDKNKYNVTLIYLDKKNNFFEVSDFSLNNKKEKDLLTLKNYDIVFPIMHGSYFENGSFQGVCEFLNIKYVGNNLESSILCMDKVLTKKMFDLHNIPNAPYLYIYKDYDLNILKKDISEKIGYPCIIKPCDGGSSIGVSKCLSEKDLSLCLEEAFVYTNKVLIEKYVKNKEVEVAVLGNDDLIISNVGEILGCDFYD